MKQKMNIVAAVVAGLCAISAQAGQLAGNPSTIYAAETITNTALVTVPTFTYQTSEPINGPVTATTNTIYFVVKSNAGVFKGAASAAITGANAPTVKLLPASSGSNQGSVATPAAFAAGIDGVLVTTPVVIDGVTYTSSGATANNTLVYSFAIPQNTIYGLGSNVYVGSTTSAGGAAITANLTGLSTALGLGAFNDCAAFVGGAVDLTVTVGNSTGGGIDKIAPYAPTKTLLKSSLGVAADVVASTDTAVVDAVGNSSLTYTRTAGGGVATAINANLGTLTLTDAVPLTTDLTLTNYTTASLVLATATNGIVVTVDGDFTGQAGAAALNLNTSPLCAAGTNVAGGVTTYNAGKTQAVLTYGAFPTVTSGTPYYVCYAPNGTATLPAPTNYTVSATLNAAAGGVIGAAYNYGKLSSGGVCPASTFASALNASRVVVRNYSPAAANAFGWNQYTRIINTGATAATPSARYVYGDGTKTAFKAVGGAIAAGGNVTLSNTTIEAALGAPVQPTGITTNPRLEVQAPTGSLRVQNYIVQPSGAWFEASGAQTENATNVVGSQQ